MAEIAIWKIRLWDRPECPSFIERDDISIGTAL